MTEWTQYDGGPQHAGHRRDLAGPQRVETDWTVDLSGAVGAPVLDRDTIFVGTERGNMYAFDRETGRRRWTYETLERTDATPVVTRGRVVFASGGDTLTAVDPARGDLEWETSLPSSVTTPTLDDGQLYVGHADGVSALEADTGDVRWTHETDAPVVAAPVIADARVRDRDWEHSRVFAALENETVVALEVETGEEIWTAPTDGVVTASPTVADGRVYVGDDDGTLLALDTNSGRTWFSYEIRDAFTSSATVLPEAESTFIGAADGYLHVTDTTFGRRKLRGWLFAKKGVALDGEIRASPVVIGDVVCVGDTTGSLYGLDRTDDYAHLWHFGTDDSSAITSTPAVGEEQLFVGSDDGRLHCLTWTATEQ